MIYSPLFSKTLKKLKPSTPATMAAEEPTLPHTKFQNLANQHLRDWSILLPELVDAILQRLPFVDVLRSKSVCSSWASVVKYYISSPSLTRHVRQTPWLMVFEKRDHEEEYNPNYACFYNLSEKKVYTMKNVDYGRALKRQCIGSSYGWLVCWDMREKPHLTNPFSGSKIELPSLGDDNFSFFNSQVKAILTADPSHSRSYEVVFINGFSYSLSYWKSGDKAWTDVDEGSIYYYDIICHENLLYALTLHGLVEIWDFHGASPRKLAELQPSILEEEEVVERFPEENFSVQWYLVNSEGDVLLVRRIIGNFVDENGNVVALEDLVKDEQSYSSTYAYKTMGFRVYTLDSSKQQWVGIESLGNRILFLGGNHSVSMPGKEIPEFEEDSIYFTDDNWNQMGEYFGFGGHDMGIYNMKDGCLKPIYPYQAPKIFPPPFFVFPNPW